jgi:hypothetical protein
MQPPDLQKRKGPPRLADADGPNRKKSSRGEATQTGQRAQAQSQSHRLRRMARVLFLDGYAGIRTRVFALNAGRALACGRLDPADVAKLIAAYRDRRAQVRAAARAYR